MPPTVLLHHASPAAIIGRGCLLNRITWKTSLRAIKGPTRARRGRLTKRLRLINLLFISEGYETEVVKNVDIDAALANPEGKAVKIREIETFVMKKHFPRLVQTCLDNALSPDGRYGNCARLIHMWCAVNQIVISRVQLETVELNLPYHCKDASRSLTEAEPLGLASVPPLPSPPQQHDDGACASPIQATSDLDDDEREAVEAIFSRLQSEGLLSPDPQEVSGSD